MWEVLRRNKEVMTLETGFVHTTISVCLPKSALLTDCSHSHSVSDEIGSVYEISSKLTLVAIESRAQKQGLPTGPGLA